jgi:hypothetical protein
MDGLIEQFTQGALGAGVETVVANELQEAAPPASTLAPHLLELLPRAGEKGRFAIADLAAALAADPGYRPVVEAAVREGRVERAYWGSFLRTGTSLDGEALRWWLDLVVTEPRATAGVLVALDQRLDAVLPAERDAIVAFLVATDVGPARYHADVAAEVLRRCGPCPPLESMFSRWIRDGRFDGNALDAEDGGTSVQILAMGLESCVTEGPFTVAWSLVHETLGHWNELLSSPDPRRRRSGLANMSTLLMFKTSFAGTLPRGIAASVRADSPEWAALQAGFQGVELANRSPGNAGLVDERIREARKQLKALARGEADPTLPPSPAESAASVPQPVTAAAARGGWRERLHRWLG